MRAEAKVPRLESRFSDVCRLIAIAMGQKEAEIWAKQLDLQPARNDNLDFIDVDAVPSESARKYVQVKITDQDKGIPVDIIDKVFDPYFSTKTQGSGLGLSIVHSIISKHEGHGRQGGRAKNPQHEFNDKIR